jgi:hypothetical protein
MPSEDVREAVDERDVDALRAVVRCDPSLMTSLVDAPGAATEPSSTASLAAICGGSVGHDG